jgi:hypothetical protein
MPTATLYSPMISVETANTHKLFLFCNIVNVSAQPRSGTLEILRGDGTPVSTASFNNVPPGVGTGISISQTPLPPNPAPVTLVYAKVTVQGNATDIRASLILADAKGNTIVSADAH